MQLSQEKQELMRQAREGKLGKKSVAINASRLSPEKQKLLSNPSGTFPERAIVQPAADVASGIVSATADIADTLAWVTDKVANITKLKKGGYFDEAAQQGMELGKYLRERGIRDKDSIAKVMKGVYAGMGRASVDVPMLMSGGETFKGLGMAEAAMPATFGTMGAVGAAKEGGELKDIALAATTGALTGEVIKGAQYLPKPIRLPTLFGIGAAAPGTTEERVASGIVFAGLGASGKGRTVEELLRPKLAAKRYQQRINDILLEPYREELRAEKAKIVEEKPTRNIGRVPAEYTQDALKFISDNFISPDVEDTNLYHVTTAKDKVYKEGLKPRKETKTEGLGGGIDNQAEGRISVTFDSGHAQRIADRLKLAVKAARNELTPVEILDKFIGDTMIPDDTPYEIAQALRAPEKVWDDWELFDKWLFTEYKGKSYELLQELDDSLSVIYSESEYPSGRVGLTASASSIAKIDPDQIGIIEVAARNTARPEHIADEMELRFKPEDVWVVSRGETTETPRSGTAKRISAKAIELGMASGFDTLAPGVDPIEIKRVAKEGANVVNADLQKAHNIVKGIEPAKSHIDLVGITNGLLQYAADNPSAPGNGQILADIVNSPTMTVASETAQLLGTFRIFYENTAFGKLKEIKNFREKKASHGRIKKNDVVKSLDRKTKQVNLTREELSWEKFLDGIKC